MTIPAPPSGLQPEDFERIEDAVMETARGRWFLLEYARRLRAAETDRLLAAIERLERRAQGTPAGTPAGAAPDASGLAERLQDFAWTLRERGLDDSVCAELEGFAREAAGRFAPSLPRAGSLAGEDSQTPDLAGSPGEAPNAPPLPPKAGEGWGGGMASRVQNYAPPPAHDPRLVALSRLDQLPLVEKLALFG